MKKLLVSMAVVGALLALGRDAAADVKLELGIDLSPTLLQDPAFEAFSSDDLRSDRFGGDLRLQVASLGNNIKLLPVVGYRVSLDEGDPFYQMETVLQTHEAFAGLRFRGWFKPWLGAFIQVTGGACWAVVEGGIETWEGEGAREDYSAEAVTWTVEGLLGVEFRLSPAFLARRGVTRFNFGGEIGVGYNRKGEMEVTPKLEGGDENSLPVRQTEPWGAVNLSGWVAQVGITLSFF